MTLVLRYAARSDRGLVRSNNEDSVYAGARLLAALVALGFGAWRRSLLGAILAGLAVLYLALATIG